MCIFLQILSNLASGLAEDGSMLQLSTESRRGRTARLGYNISFLSNTGGFVVEATINIEKIPSQGALIIIAILR